MIRFVRGNNMDLWEKHRGESDQSICIIGVIILGVKLCEVDGHFSDFERDEILKTIPHEENQKNTLLKLIEEAEKDKNPIDYHAERIKKFIAIEHKDFLEFIVAVLIKFAKSDHRYSEVERNTIEKVAMIFGIRKNESFLDINLQNIKQKLNWGSINNG